MNKNRLLQYVSVFDLVAISVWALYHYWGNHGENVPFPGNESVWCGRCCGYHGLS